MITPKRHIFVTGTDTDVGKTIAAAFLCIKLNANYHKPIQSGAEFDNDTQTIKEISLRNDQQIKLPRFTLKAPLSPHLASRIEDIQINLSDFTLPQFKNDNLTIIEGAGGILVPLNETDMVIDLIKYLNIPTIIATRSSLGTINHTLLTIKTLQTYNIPILGAIMLGTINNNNLKAIEHYGQIKVIAQIPQLSQINKKTLEEIPLQKF